MGTRYYHQVKEGVSPYVGLAYEYEFNGQARASTNGFNIDVPSLKGGTGIGEIGLSIRPNVSRPLSLDFGVQGYTGKREGITGRLIARWFF
jgi:outer membrane protein W